MAMELFEKGTYMYSLMADYWVLNRKLLKERRILQTTCRW